MNSAARTGARPPQTRRLCFSVPLSRASGATPTGAAICLRGSVPSSGSSPMSVRLSIGPTPGVERKQVFFGAPDGTGLDGVVQVPVDIVQLAFEPPNMLGEAAAHRGHGVFEAITLGNQHLQYLASPGEQRVEGLSGVIGQRARGRAHALGEERQDVGIDPIGFGELAGGPGNVADLSRVGDDQRQPGRRKCGNRRALGAASGLEDDERRRVAADALDECLDAGAIIGQCPALP